jgi:hypothetical protein
VRIASFGEPRVFFVYPIVVPLASFPCLEKVIDLRLEPLLFVVGLPQLEEQIVDDLLCGGG